MSQSRENNTNRLNILADYVLRTLDAIPEDEINPEIEGLVRSFYQSASTLRSFTNKTKDGITNTDSNTNSH
jgi:hypothetical protein